MLNTDMLDRYIAATNAAQARVEELEKALELIAEGRPDNPVGDPWAFYDDLVSVARRALEGEVTC